VLSEGIYQENIDFNGKNLTLRSTNPHDPQIVATTVITGDGNNNVVTFSGGEDANCVLAGFTITGGKRGIYCSGSSPIVTNCTITGNVNADMGAGMYIENGSNPTLVNCMFSSNSASLMGGGMYTENSSPILINCTFAGNSATYYLGGGIYCAGGSLELTNCILWSGTPDEITIYSGNPVITYSNIQGGFTGEGNINADPLFADAGTGDYHLKSQAGRWDPNIGSWIKDEVTSPCIDSGDPNSDWSDETWPHGGRINMGAYGGTSQASMSLEIDGMSLPNVAYIYSYDAEAAQSFQSLLESYGCPTTLIRSSDSTAAPLDSYDLIIVAHDTQHADPWSDPNTVAAIEDSGKPIVGLGDGGYDFFGLLGLSIGNPYGGHASKNSIEVVDPNSSLFSTPYSIDIPQDRALQLYTETSNIGIYLWPTVPETVTVFGNEVNAIGYYPLVMEHNRYLLWGFIESPDKMTEIGKTLFINVIIWTANKAWESDE
jgi:predicted outer membrane repeat protein